MSGSLVALLLAASTAVAAHAFVIWLRWVLDQPSDGQWWWAMLPAAGGAVAIGVVAASRTTAATADAFVYGMQRNVLTGSGAPARFAALICGVGLGVPLGYEGPMVYFGGVVGAVGGAPIGRRLGSGRRSAMLACATAGVAMVIGAPVAAALFTTEIMRRGWPRAVEREGLVIGAVAAWLVRRSLGERGGVVGVPPAVATGSVMIGALVIGVVGGLAGRAFAGAIIRSKLARWSVGTRLVVVPVTLVTAVTAGRVASGEWIYVGSGDRLLEWARSAAAGWVVVATIVFAALVLTMLAGGVVGGLFLPLVSLGGATGLVLTRSWVPGVSPAVAVGIGGCALLASGYGTPLAAVAVGVSTFGVGAAGLAAAVAVGVAAAIGRGATASLHRR